MSSKRQKQRWKNARLRKNQKKDGYFELSEDFNKDDRRCSIDRKKTLDDVNKLKNKIIDFFNNNDFNKAEKNMQFLCKNQTDKIYLVKSLNDIASKINSNNAKLLVSKLSYEINNVDTITLTSYATALSSNKDYKKAFELFEKSLNIDDGNIITLFSFGICLKNNNEYEKSINIFLKILKQDNLILNQKKFVYLTLGLLNLHIGSSTLSRKYFNLFIDSSKDVNTALMKTALTIFKKNPYDKEGINKLLQISCEEGSKLFEKVFGLLSISLPQEEYFKHFNINVNDDNAIKKTLELNNAIYHKIDNQINILRSLLELAILKNKDDNFLKPLQEIKIIVLDIFNIIKDNKNKEKESKEINRNNYKNIIEHTSEIAHHIADKINNKMFIIKTKLELMLPLKIIEIDNQIETTIATLNNFKDLKQGSIKAKFEPFRLSRLLTNLKHNMKLDNAIIHINIKDGNIVSDKQKITECINELIENSIRHNSDKTEINVWISLEMVLNPIIINEKKEGDYLKIVYKDDGKGIEKDKKEWVFNPLNTTMKNGSGLGLFIIKRIIEKIKARIYEDGVNGVRFMIYIPNLKQG